MSGAGVIAGVTAAIASTDRSTSSNVVRWLQTEIADAAPPAPGRPARPARALRLDRRERGVRRRVGTERDEHLVEPVRQHLVARARQPVGEAVGARAQAVDELGDAVAAERAQDRVDRQPARPARELGSPVHRLARAGRVLDEVGGGERHRGAVRLAVADERDPAVVGHLQPLVPVRRPRVGVLGPRDRCRAGCGSPPPTGRTRRRRAPRRPRPSRPRRPRASGRSRRCSRCRPGR